MVRWKQDNEAGGLQLPGTGYIWTNNVDTLHNTWTSIASDRLLNEVRGQWSRYYDLRAAKCDCVQVNRTGYSVTGGVATGTWGVIPEDTWDVSDTLSLWRGAHSFKMGGGVTYDVDHAALPAQSERRLQLCGRPDGCTESEPVHPGVRARAGTGRDLSEGVGAQRLRCRTSGVSAAT